MATKAPWLYTISTVCTISHEAQQNSANCSIHLHDKSTVAFLQKYCKGYLVFRKVIIFTAGYYIRIIKRPVRKKVIDVIDSKVDEKL